MRTNFRAHAACIFLASIWFCAGALAQEAGTPAPKPLTVAEPDPAKSFWRDQVQYPYPVKYAKAADGRGVTWEIAYMDEYAGPPAQKAAARTLVLIHGRGTSAATWAEVMQTGLRAGLRVIALDIPHYGKSIPGNLDKPLARSLSDIREVFYNVIVEQLQARKAIYLGHSLGGQLAAGYALRYPQAVERLVLVATGGLEEFHPTGLYQRGFERDMQAWDQVWKNIGLLGREFARQPHTIEADYYFQGDGRNPGYFLRDGAIPRFITETRKKMIAGNEKEYRNYVTTYIREIYHVGSELLSNDPQNLTRRLGELKMPVFLAMGARDPFFPVKVATGNSSVKLDLIKPFHDRLQARGNPPQVKLYDAGHFLFTDQAELFQRDLMAFIDGREVAGRENVAAYETSLLHDLAIGKKLSNFWQELVLDCTTTN
jgi:homoserine O-acetyltransferase